MYVLYVQSKRIFPPALVAIGNFFFFFAQKVEMKLQYIYSFAHKHTLELSTL